MTEKEIEDFLYQIPKFTTKNDLEHTRTLLQELGNPAVSIPRIQVAGTNGKGSVCAYLQALLQKKGCKTGTFISPHLVSVRERFLINGIPVESEQYEDAFHQVAKMVTKIQDKGIAHPTFFEFLFLMAMEIFGAAGVDVILLETGLGGRLDATNALDGTKVCILTSIGLDHCEYLGDTVEEIAAEKAGIIKDATIAVFADEPQNVSDVFIQKCNEIGAKASILKKEDFLVEKIKHKSIDFSYKSIYYNNISLTASVYGVYQVQNASLALRGFEQYLQIMNMTPLSEDSTREAILNTEWEGRMEEIMPRVFVDGAHNEGGIEAFLQSVQELEKRGKYILCFSAVRDKKYDKMIEQLVQSHMFDEWIVIEMQQDRGVKENEFMEAFNREQVRSISYFLSAEEGFEFSLKQQMEEDTVFVVGSLYLVGLIKATLRRNLHDQF